ncbi:MAG: VIT and VWA domain-containing protein, partial [Planctomycetaceae bacterium]
MMKKSRYAQWGICLIVGFGLGNSAQAAGLLVADGGFGGVLKIEEHAVRVVVNNGIAVTRVTQVFRNTENRQVEALYTFPVPQEASVSNFSMWINGQEMVGEVLEKKRAREIYESYKRKRRDPGLLEQTDYKTFEMRIFPIAAGAEQRVEITYYQELNFDHDRATYVYPLATSTRKGLDSRTTGKFALTLEAKSEVPIVATDSPSHTDDFVIVNHTPEYMQASLETRAGDLNRDVVLSYQISRAQTGLDIITSKPKGTDGYLCLTVTAGEELSPQDRGMDYVFILDVSGSMAHDGKMRLSRESIGSFVDELGAQDRFEVIAFNVALSKLFGQLQPWTDDAKQQSRTFLRSQKARGGTVLHPAVTTAYQYGDPDRQLNVIILSDGMTEQQEQAELLQLIAERPGNAKVFCIGVGNEVNRPLLNQLATDAGGLASFISHGDNFDRQAQAFRRKLTRPVASDVRINFGGVDVYDVVPKVLPNLYHGSPVRLYARYRGTGLAEIQIQAEVNGTPLNQT